jgi:hypothetical protein
MKTSGALLVLLVTGCVVPEIECGLVRVGEPEPGPEPGNCKTVTVTGDSRVSKAADDACTALDSTCVVLMPGDSAVGWQPTLEGNETIRAERESAALTVAGRCPLACK